MLRKITEDLHIRSCDFIVFKLLLLLIGAPFFGGKLPSSSSIHVSRDVSANVQTASLLPFFHVVVGFVEGFHVQKLFWGGFTSLSNF
jgi:hypothetical protein